MVVINPDTDFEAEAVGGGTVPLNIYSTGAHEILGHAYDGLYQPDTDSAIETENISRKVLGLEERSGSDHSHSATVKSSTDEKEETK